ncbi:MAG TPA: porin [Planctomycetota bacterium]
MLRTRARLVLVLPCLSTLAASSAAQEKSADKPQKSVEERLADLEKKMSGDTMRVFWKDGLRFETSDKKYRFKLGGRIHYDGQFFDQDSETEAAVETSPTTRIEDGTEFRRVRLETSGEVAERVDWALAVDFAGGSTNLRNAYAGIKDLPFGNVRAGQFKEPFSLESQTSSNNLLFTERSLAFAFVPHFNAGVMVFDTLAEERMTWAVGGFRTASDAGEVSKDDGAWAGTARITGLPYYAEDGKGYVHLGAGYSMRSPTDDGVTFSSKPEANLAPSYVSSGALAAEDVTLMGLEAAWTAGSLTVSGEYTMASVDGDTGTTSDPDFSGYYVQASYLITGESRPYSKTAGAFGAVKPEENAFGEDNGIGAWEVATRMSSIDLVDDGTDGGELDDLTFGVNWYLNPNSRLMLDYILADLDPSGGGASGDTSIFAFRWQFNF